MSKLNSKKIENAKSEGKERRLADGNGLFLRIRPSEAKSWLFCYRLGNDRKWLQMTLGSLRDLALKEARDKIIELRKLVAEGIDPRHAKAATIAENMQAVTMQVLFDRWIEHEKVIGRVKIKCTKNHEARWRLHLKKSLGNILAKNVTRAHLSASLDVMTHKGMKEVIRKTLTTLNLMMDYGLKRQLLDQNPARLLKPKDFAATVNKPRTRVLSLEELRKLWLAIDQAATVNKFGGNVSSMSLITASAIKLLILTGARRGEVAAMQWKELDLNTGIWTLPAERTKNSQAHTIYLSDLAIETICLLRPMTSGSNFVFDTGYHEKGGHIHPDTLTSVTAKLRGASKKNKFVVDAPLSNMRSFSVHDLRRSAATAWGEYLKTEPHIIERMLNHQPMNKLIATYQRAVYAEEQKKAWLSWGKLVNQHIAH